MFVERNAPEVANSVEAVQDGRIPIEKSTRRFRTSRRVASLFVATSLVLLGKTADAVQMFTSWITSLNASFKPSFEAQPKQCLWSCSGRHRLSVLEVRRIAR
jgi:hypothetical protein